MKIASRWTVCVASCVCVCVLWRLNPPQAYSCSYTACPELLYTDLCKGVSLSSQCMLCEWERVAVWVCEGPCASMCVCVCVYFTFCVCLQTCVRMSESKRQSWARRKKHTHTPKGWKMHNFTSQGLIIKAPHWKRSCRQTLHGNTDQAIVHGHSLNNQNPGTKKKKRRRNQSAWTSDIAKGWKNLGPQHVEIKPERWHHVQKLIFYLVSCYNSWLHVEQGQTKGEGDYKRFMKHR